MDLSDIITVGLIAFMVGVFFTLGMLGLIRSAAKGVPRMENPPPPPPKRARQWYRLKVSELKEGEVYRCRFTQQRVQVRKIRLKPDSPCLPQVVDQAVCDRFNPITGEMKECHLRDGQLETDDPMLHPPTVEKLMRIPPRPPATVIHPEGDYDLQNTKSPATHSAWRDLQS